MHNDQYDDLLIRVEDDLTERHLNPVIIDNVDLYKNSSLEGVTFIKDGRVFIFIERSLDTFNKATTLVEEYFHAISDFGDHLDYSGQTAQNDEINAREDVIGYMTSEQEILRVARRFDDQPFAAWMLAEYFGYPQDFAEETIAYYQRKGIIK